MALDTKEIHCSRGSYRSDTWSTDSTASYPSSVSSTVCLFSSTV